MPVEAIFSAPVQTGSGAHPASYTVGTGSFPGVKRPGRGIDHPHPARAEDKERVELYYSTSGPSRPVLGQTLRLPLFTIQSLTRFLYKRINVKSLLQVMKAYRGSRGIVPLILNVGNRWTLVVKCTPRERNTDAVLAREPVWKIWTREQKKSHVTGGLERRIFQAVACFVYWLRYTGCRGFLCISLELKYGAVK
jgi:hypothetical protein